MRLTILYAGLFLASGTVLLAFTDLMMAGLIHRSDAIRMGELMRVVRNVELNRRTLHVSAPAHAGIQGQTTHALQQQAAGDLTRLVAVSGIALAVMVLVSAGLGWLVAGRVLRPLQAMTTAARQISEENLHERLAAEGPDDELKDLSDTIDGLLARLDAAFAAQRRFVANASHELRTPLAMMRTSLDVAEAKPGPMPPEVAALARKVREGLDQADRLLEGLLVLARAQHGGVEREPTDLSRVLTDAIGGRGDAITERALLVHSASGPALLSGNPVLLARLVGNLIDNAIRYNKAGGWIRAEAEADAMTARLVVENSGQILDQTSVQELTQPFRRIGADRTGSATGTGLGLSIIDAVVSAHGGALWLHARPQGGLRVAVELPAAHADTPAPPLALTGALR